MSENNSNVTKLNFSNRRSVVRILVLCAAVLVVAAVLTLVLFAEELNMDKAGRWLHYLSVGDRETYGSYSYDAHSSNRYAPAGDGLAIASAGGVETYREDGTVGVRLALSMTNPAVRSGGGLVLAYDIGGSELTLLHPDKGELLKRTEEGKIFDADLSFGGTLVTSVAESGYKTVLRVYDSEQKELFRWFSASRYMPHCAVAPGGKLFAASAVGHGDGSYKSTVCLFSVHEEEPFAEYDLGNETVYDLRFTDDKTLWVLGEKTLTVLNENGEATGVYQLASRRLEAYDFSTEGFAVLCLNMLEAGEQYTVVTVDKNGREMAQLETSNVLDVTACGKYISVLTARELSVYRRELQRYARTPNTWLATSAFMRDDGTVLLVTGNSAHLYLP